MDGAGCRQAGYDDQGDHGRTQPFEGAFYPDIVFYLGKEEGDRQDDKEGGQDRTQGAENSAAHFLEFIADENGDIHRKDAGQGLGDGEWAAAVLVFPTPPFPVKI